MNTLRFPVLSLNRRPASSSSESTLPAYVDIPNLKVKNSKKERKSKTPSALRTWRFVTAICFMFALVIALQIALAVSVKREGFSIGKLNTSRVQFYSSFIPALLITGLVWYWRSLDRAYRRMQPYINMSQGPTDAQNSVLLDLEHMSLPRLLQFSLRTRHYLILISTTLAFTGVFYHSLASSFFFIKNTLVVFPAYTHVKSLATLGLNPLSQDLSSFVAAAGFAEAAAFHGLDDPPFIMGPWAVARFQYPTDISENSTISLNTTAIKSNLNCTALPVDVIPNAPLPSNTTLQMSVAPGCSKTVVIDPASSTNQYAAIPITNCSQLHDLESDVLSPEFSPVLFWFYTIGSGTGQIFARSVFCEVSLSTAAVEVRMDGKTGLLTNLKFIGDLAFDNNITSGPFAGHALNGIAFDSQNSVVPYNLSNPFIAARALAVQTQIPGAIFRLATDATMNPGGFTSQGILSITQSIYTQYLSVVALGNYFVPGSEELVAEVTLWPSRLFMNNLTVHILSALFIVVSVVEMVLYYLYRKRSRNLHLGTRPGFIAHCMSLLPQLESDTNGVAPTDTKEALKQKLDNMSFMLNDEGYIIGLQPRESDASGSKGTPLMAKAHLELYQDADLKSRGFEGDASWKFPRSMSTSPSPLAGQQLEALSNWRGSHRKGESLDSSVLSYAEIKRQHRKQRLLPPGLLLSSPAAMAPIPLPPTEGYSNQHQPFDPSPFKDVFLDVYDQGKGPF